MSEKGIVQHLNPAGLIKNPAFTNVIVVTGSTKTIYVGGQNAVDASGAIVGKGDIKAQVVTALKNSASSFPSVLSVILAAQLSTVFTGR